MTAKQRRAVPARDDTICPRCRERAPVVTIRTEPLCTECFAKYVNTKVVKRMETFRVRNSEPNKQPVILLALSLGACSVSLLQILSHHLRGQIQKTGRAGSRLHVMHVVDSQTQDSLVDEIKARYPEHSYSVCPLSDVMKSDDGVLAEHFPSYDKQDGNSLDALLASIASTTARTDMISILRSRLIVNFAKTNNCQAVIWGHSTTRLAELTLAETAKGRGSYLPWAIADGTSPHGIPFYFPMRDLLTKEIESYAKLADPSLPYQQEETPTNVSTKNASIDSLMRQYFESAELEYPSIVANVVKTASKLKPAPLESIEQQCELCDMPLEGQAPEKSRLCYGCIGLMSSTTT